ncbi:MFS transporter [Sciscionella marina]|uniref:MFS transporter n=1 Tax=Sciscionella marina TaxID=508770 RepID=UPI0012F6C40B|nr:MFS transporter [Sciscionella marina]
MTVLVFPAAARDLRDMSTRHSWLTLAVLCVTLFVGAVDFTVLNLALPAIEADLVVTPSTRGWILDSYPMTVAALLLTVGALADRVDRKRLWLSGLVLFGLSSLLAVFAGSAALLVAARFGQGIGEALLLASTVAILRASFPDPAKRGTAVGLWTASSSLGAACGPVLGGVLIEQFGWRSAFLINVPIVALAAVFGAVLIIRVPPAAHRSWDVPGSLLSIGVLGLLLYTLNHVTANRWPLTAALLLIVLLGIAAFLVRQRKARVPLVRLQVFASGAFGASMLFIVLSFGSYLAFLLLVAQQWQRGGMDPQTAGFGLVPAALANALGSALAPLLVRRWGQRTVTGFALALLVCGLLLFGLAGAAGNYPALVLLGFGAGTVMSVCTDTVLGHAELARSGEIGALQETVFNLGSAVWLAAASALLTRPFTGTAYAAAVLVAVLAGGGFLLWRGSRWRAVQRRRSCSQATSLASASSSRSPNSCSARRSR